MVIYCTIYIIIFYIVYVIYYYSIYYNIILWNHRPLSGPGDSPPVETVHSVYMIGSEQNPRLLCGRWRKEILLGIRPDGVIEIFHLT